MTSDDTLESRLKESVRNYLVEDKWKVNPVAGHVTWAFVAEDNQGRKIVVGQQPDRRDAIFVQASLTVSEDWQKLLSLMDPYDRSKLLWDIRFELLKMEPEFSGLTDELKTIVITQRIFFDGMTKDTFFQRVSQVRKSLLAAWWSLARAVSHDPSPDDQVGD